MNNNGNFYPCSVVKTHTNSFVTFTISISYMDFFALQLYSHQFYF